METRIVETAGIDTEGAPLYAIRWPAVFAGLAVGLGINLLLMLIGIAAGFAVFGSGARPEGSSVSIAAAIWNTISMALAALIGGYVAARSSGLRRATDGMLHGVVAWGATLLCLVALTGSVTGNALSGMVNVAANTAGIAATRSSDTSMAELLATLEKGDRDAAVRMLRDRFGLSQEQANTTADRALSMTGRGSTTSSDKVTGAAQAASTASAWLSMVILLSLLAGAGGGLLGARGARQRALPGRHVEHRVHLHSTGPEIGAR
ncbi:MAG: hypothetical protein ACM3X0_01830 [Bacteroidota bacterium]